MNKRSAIAVALGLVAALAIGGFAIATGLTGPETSQASPLVTKAKRPEPIVRTVTKTVTVHKKAKAGAAPVILVSGSSSSGSSGVSTAAAPSTTAGSTSAYEDEVGYEDEVESEDHESESEDHATEDHASEDESDDD
jgi:hypothetical protein